jgi:dinuclear metal center YbgI/SA1388 family protein
MKINDIITYLESFAPLQLQEDYDNSGLITGDKNWITSSALICLDCTEEVVDEAIEKSCNLIIAHHPIVFSGLKSITGKNYIERTIIKAIKNNIAIYAIHTNLDNVKHGVNWTIAQKIGLLNSKILRPKTDYIKKLTFYCPISDSQQLKEKLWQAGAGKIGNYSHCSFSSLGEGTFMGNDNSSPVLGEKNKLHKEKEEKIEMILPSYSKNKILSTLFAEHPYEEVAYELHHLENVNQDIGSGMYGILTEPMETNDFLKHLKEVMQTDCIRYTNIHKKYIKTVAVCGGSGSFLLDDAKAIKADIFITADFKYHQFFDADKAIIIADIGHYESEQFTKELICGVLNKKFTKFATHLSGIITNPINYM